MSRIYSRARSILGSLNTLNHIRGTTIMKTQSRGFRCLSRSVIAAIGISLTSSPLSAVPHHTASGHVTFFGAGWNEENARVQLDIPFENPESCPASDGYITDPSTQSGIALLNSTLLTAFSTNVAVVIVIDGCYLSRPRIIGVHLQK